MGTGGATPGGSRSLPITANGFQASHSSFDSGAIANRCPVRTGGDPLGGVATAMPPASSVCNESTSREMPVIPRLARAPPTAQNLLSRRISTTYGFSMCTRTRPRLHRS